MPKCPHCGEPHLLGQENCYACGQRLRRTGLRGRRVPVNPLVLAAGGAALVIAVVGVILVLPRSGKEQAEKARSAELERVQDSVRRANREQRDSLQAGSEASQLSAEVNKLDERYRTVRSQVAGDKPSAAQQKLIGAIESQLGRMRMLVTRIDGSPVETRPALKDTLRLQERQVRGMISDLTRLPRTR